MSTGYDWRTLAAASSDPATRHKPTELTQVQREILRLHRQEGLQVRDLATLFGMSDHDVYVLIHGDEPGTA